MPKKKKAEEPVVGTLADLPEEGTVSTGIEEVDELLNGGFPRRRITQVYGMPGVGKGFLMAKAMAKNEHRVLYIDAEFALNKSLLESSGIDMAKVDHIANSQLEYVADYIVDNIGKYDLVIIDSLAALTPMTILQDEIGSSTVALAARRIGHFIAKLRPALYTSEAAVVGINQVRANMGMGHVETKVAGGFAWSHAIDLSLKLYKGASSSVVKQKNLISRTIGHMCTVKIEKSRSNNTGKETKFLVEYLGESDG